MTRTEQAIKDRLEAIGYGVLRGGWPDFLITKDGKLHSVVEVKGGFDQVKPHQEQLHQILRDAGIRVHVVREHEIDVFLWGMEASAPEDWMERARHDRIQDLLEQMFGANDAPGLRDSVMPQGPDSDDGPSQLPVK